MALVRCKDHPPNNDRAKSPYTSYVLPVGHPQTAVICGRKSCEHSAYLWLNEWEQLRHKQGARIFQVGSYPLKVRALDHLVCD
jgi:hypothetical protein